LYKFVVVRLPFASEISKHASSIPTDKPAISKQLRVLSNTIPAAIPDDSGQLLAPTCISVPNKGSRQIVLCPPTLKVMEIRLSRCSPLQG